MAEAKKDKSVENRVKSLDKPKTKKAAKLSSTPDSKLQTLNSGDNVAVAKAGKRSAKAIKEVEEKQAKAERKAKTADEVVETKSRKAIKPARSKLERRSKNYRKSAELIDRNKAYDLKEAIDLAKKTSTVKFDASVELHINLEVDPKQADQNIRGTVVLPAGTGKTLRVAVASDDLLAKLDKGTIDFDVLVSTPDFMPKLGKYAKLLGPRGLMPNPKSGTITKDVDKAVEESKGGKVEYRVDSVGIVHTVFGKVSFDANKLEQNALALLSAIKAAKPASIKGIYIKSAFIATTMGPSIKLKLD